MGVRKSTDYSSMFTLLDALLAAELPLIKLYYEIGRIVSSSPEKGAAIAAAEYLQNVCPDAAGFSPVTCAGCGRFTRRMQIRLK